MADRYLVPRRLDDPEQIGFWTLDEFAGMLIPFAWGILAQHIFRHRARFGTRLWQMRGCWKAAGKTQ